MKTPTKTRHASDITLRNLKAAAKRHADLTGRLDVLVDDYVRLSEGLRKTMNRADTIEREVIGLSVVHRQLANRVDALERRQEAASQQPERVERDNIEGQGITPLPSTASTPETRHDEPRQEA